MSIKGGIIKADRLVYNVIPSDEELLEAYLRGNIAYQDYLDLKELFRDGADSAEMSVLEAMAGSSYLLRNYLEGYAEEVRDREEQFRPKAALSGTKNRAGFLRFSRYQELSDPGGSRGRFLLKATMKKQWTLDIGFDEDVESRWRTTRRSLTFVHKDCLARKMVLGNFATQWGLGLAVGRCGKILNKEALSMMRSLTYPDYSGFNGVYLEGGRCLSGFTMLVHADGDEGLNSGAAAVGYSGQFGRVRAGGILSSAVIGNNETGADYRSNLVGTYCRYSKGDFSVATEVSVRGYSRPRILAAVFESSCKNEFISWNLSGWHYGNGIPNLIGGGYSGSFYQQVVVDPVGLSFASKRYDQRGILLRSRATVNQGITYELSLSVYGGSTRAISSKMFSTLAIEPTKESRVHIDFKYQREQEWSEVTEDKEMGAGYRLKGRKYGLHSYIGFIQNKSGARFFSCFTRIRSTLSGFGIIELWLNMDKISIDNAHIDYLYGYLRESVALTESLELGAKYSYRYSRLSENRDKGGFWFEAKWTW